MRKEGEIMMDWKQIVVAGSLVVVGMITIGFAGAIGGWVNKDLFTVPVINMTVTPLALMGLVPLSLGAGMLLSGGDLLDVKREVYAPAVLDL